APSGPSCARRRPLRGSPGECPSSLPGRPARFAGTMLAWAPPRHRGRACTFRVQRPLFAVRVNPAADICRAVRHESMGRRERPRREPRMDDAGVASTARAAMNEVQRAPIEIEQRLLPVVEALLYENGYTGLNIREIAKTVGMGPATIYKYFSS